MTSRRDKRKQKKLSDLKKRIKAQKHSRRLRLIEEKRAAKELFLLEREAEKLQNKAIKAAEANQNKGD